MEKNSRYFEGCGREGPINCIFLTEFHHTAGPKITCQVPEDVIAKDKFEAVSVYIIPKAQLQRSTLTITVRDLKILGFPVRIDNKKYARNAFYFNLCFVFDVWARTVQYEPLVKKLSDYLTAMEMESNFLSQQEQNSKNRECLVTLLYQVLHDLNSYKMCTLSGGTMTTHLKVVRVCSDPIQVLDHHVPVFLETNALFRSDQWDLTTQQVLPYIDGTNHVAKIASEADVENNLVKSCLQNLVYYGLVSMVPIFQYSNMYTATPKLRRLALDKRLHEECLRSVAKSGRQLPYLRDVFRLYASMTHGVTMSDLCARYNLAQLHVDERKLVQFGVLEGLIRRVERFPVLVTESCQGPLHPHFTGLHSVDELCCVLGLKAQNLLDQVDRDPAAVFIWK
ncbi:GATOR complex protein NPRL2 isoform X1 [Homalodisca vitripennis]|uniref:GATOR complex protein NPRL2 isoform X1 n=1 Tax=Homalodisca vitripennis TaxID=197043 RepID=UPI001EE9E0EB|nr:GATOR complex protein NPRL2 isoform X1 [Homalodisca vitripennis]